MTREHVLEDLLRDRAAQVEIDPGALSAILGSSAPQGDGDSVDAESRDEQTTSQSSSAEVPRQSAVASGGSAFVTFAKFVIGSLLAVLLGAVVYAAVAGTTTHCPGLDWVNGAVNDRIGLEGGGDQGVQIPCGSNTLDFDDVRDSAPPSAHADIEANRAEIESVLDCINEAATPLSLGSLFNKIPDVCVGELRG